MMNGWEPPAPRVLSVVRVCVCVCVCVCGGGGSDLSSQLC
jgi:hypothetical protein